MTRVATNEMTAETSPYLEQFARFEKQTQPPAWLFPLRKAGISSFAEQGFPTIKDEDWRFTNVSPIARLPFQPVFEPGANGNASEALDRLSLAKLDGYRLVFVDGHYSAKLSSPRT